jgi:serine/threonine-protein kinase
LPRFGNYEIEAIIGKGGMAEVYRAKVLEGRYAGRTVALKRLHPDLAKDPHYINLFTGEADLSRLLHHPNVVEVLEAGIYRDVYYIAMEFIDGRDLGQIVARCRQRGIMLPVDFAVFLVKTLLDALDYAHHLKGPNGQALHLVHCDVSPSNMFISRTGEIKLGDFGIAKVRTLDGPVTASKVWGKAYYLSPEQLGGSLSPSADLWASATTLYELLTLERPFVGRDLDEVARNIRNVRYVPLLERRPDAPEALAAVILLALSQEPHERYQTARALADAIQPYYNELVGTPLAIAAVVRGLFGA